MEGGDVFLQRDRETREGGRKRKEREKEGDRMNETLPKIIP